MRIEAVATNSILCIAEGKVGLKTPGLCDTDLNAVNCRKRYFGLVVVRSNGHQFSCKIYCHQLSGASKVEVSAENADGTPHKTKRSDLEYRGAVSK